MMTSKIKIYFLTIFTFSIVASTFAQVYINPNQPAAALIPEVKPSQATQNDLLTQTVYGFLDFTTTIGNTVMVFSPQSEPAPEPPKPSATSVIETKPQIEAKSKEIKPTKTAMKSVKPKVSTKVDVVVGPPNPQSSNVEIVASKVEIIADSPNTVQQILPAKQPAPPVFSSLVEVRADVDPEPVLIVGNNLAEPEYDLLSRQPAPFAEDSSYRVVNLKPGSGKSGSRSRPAQEQRRLQSSPPRDTHPTGLVTTITGSVVRDGVTTVHETSVIGTYISGKYAQVLQSTSHVFKNQKPKISPSSTLRILKTAAPTVPASRHQIDLAPTAPELTPLPEVHNGNPGPNLVRSSRRPATSANSFKNRIRNRNSKDEVTYEAPRDPPSTTSNSVGYGSSKKSPRHRTKSKNRRNKGRKNGQTTTSAPLPQSQISDRRSFKPKIQALPPQVNAENDDPGSYKFKLNRSPGRWQYKTSPKPRVTIRKASGGIAGEESQVTPPTVNAEVITNDIPVANARSDTGDLEPSGSVNGNVLNDAETGDNSIDNKKLLVETINVEISTPADFKDIYYEIATIKTPYTFQVGTIRNTRFITVTSTFEKSFEPEPTNVPTNPNEPLTENILASTTHIDKENNLLDSSIATLPPLYLSSDAETPPLETLTETFSTTQDMLKTHILPIIRDGENATSYTLIQTYHITRLVTATKTLPPMEAYQFVPSKRLKEFNSKLDEAGSELHLELEFGDNNDEDDEDDDEDHPVRQLPPELDLANIGSDFDLFDVDRAKLGAAQQKAKKKAQKVAVDNQAKNLSPDQLQQLALLRLLNPAAAAQVPQVVTTSKPVVKLETVYETHVIPIFNGQSTTLSTISRPVGTVSKTEFEIETSTIAAPVPALPQLPVNPLFQQQQPFGQAQFQLTTAPIVTQTVVTQTQSKILKLTFGAKTAYTTLFSTNVVPTILTTYVTTSVPVQPTAAAFPGYYPAPFAPYPFVG